MCIYMHIYRNNLGTSPYTCVYIYIYMYIYIYIYISFRMFVYDHGGSVSTNKTRALFKSIRCRELVREIFGDGLGNVGGGYFGGCWLRVAIGGASILFVLEIPTLIFVGVVEKPLKSFYLIRKMLRQ